MFATYTKRGFCHHCSLIIALAVCLLELVLTTSKVSARFRSEQPPLPPAIYYGWITASSGFNPMLGMSLQAEINGIICGQTVITELNGGLAYMVQVIAENSEPSYNGCGANDRTVIFKIDNWQMDHNRTWNNGQAWFHPLSLVVQNVPTPTTGTPSLTSSPTPTSSSTSTPNVTNTAENTPSVTPTFTRTPTSIPINFLPIITR